MSGIFRGNATAGTAGPEWLFGQRDNRNPPWLTGANYNTRFRQRSPPSTVKSSPLM
jgi:hypothetical protein